MRVRRFIDFVVERLKDSADFHLTGDDLRLAKTFRSTRSPSKNRGRLSIGT